MRSDIVNEKGERRSFVNSIEYIPWIQLDNEQKEMINGFVKDYDELKAKLSSIEEYINGRLVKTTGDILIIKEILRGNNNE